MSSPSFYGKSQLFGQEASLFQEENSEASDQITRLRTQLHLQKLQLDDYTHQIKHVEELQKYNQLLIKSLDRVRSNQVLFAGGLRDIDQILSILVPNNHQSASRPALNLNLNISPKRDLGGNLTERTPSESGQTDRMSEYTQREEVVEAGESILESMGILKDKLYLQLKKFKSSQTQKCQSTKMVSQLEQRLATEQEECRTLKAQLEKSTGKKDSIIEQLSLKCREAEEKIQRKDIEITQVQNEVEQLQKNHKLFQEAYLVSQKQKDIQKQCQQTLKLLEVGKDEQLTHYLQRNSLGLSTSAKSERRNKFDLVFSQD